MGASSTFITPGRSAKAVHPPRQRSTKQADPMAATAQFPWPPTLSSLTVSDQDLTATDTAPASLRKRGQAQRSFALTSAVPAARADGNEEVATTVHRDTLACITRRTALRWPVDSACEFTRRSSGENCRTRLVAYDRGGAGDRDARGVGFAVDGPSDAVAGFAGGFAVSRHRYDGRLLGVRTRTTGRCGGCGQRCARRSAARPVRRGPATRSAAPPPAGGELRVGGGLLGSRVTLRDLSVYDLDPRDVGEFDLVVMGYVLQMLRDPLRALEAIRRGGRGHLVVLDTISLPLELLRTPLAAPRRPTRRQRVVRVQSSWTSQVARARRMDGRDDDAGAPRSPWARRR